MSRNHLSHIMILCTTLIALTACGETIDVSFGSLSGNYSYADDGWICDGRVAGSRINAECIVSMKDEGWEYDYESQTNGQGSLTATLGSERLEAELTFESVTTAWEGDYECSSESEAITIRVVASKRTPRDVDGVFGAIAGRWSVAIDFETTRSGRWSEEGASSFSACKNATVAYMRPTSREVWTSGGDVDVMSNVVTGEIAWQERTYTLFEDGRVSEVYTEYFDPSWNEPESFDVSGSSFGLTIGNVGITKL